MHLNLHENCISSRDINKHVTTHMLDSYLDIKSRIGRNSKMKYISKFTYFWILHQHVKFITSYMPRLPTGIFWGSRNDMWLVKVDSTNVGKARDD